MSPSSALSSISQLIMFPVMDDTLTDRTLEDTITSRINTPEDEYIFISSVLELEQQRCQQYQRGLWLEQQCSSLVTCPPGTCPVIMSSPVWSVWPRVAPRACLRSPEQIQSNVGACVIMCLNTQTRVIIRTVDTSAESRVTTTVSATRHQ